MYRTIIFDLDGTLLNTLDDLRDSTNYALSQYGYPERSLDEIRSFVGNGIRKLIERALPKDVTQEEYDKVFEAFKGHYRVHCNDKTGPYPGIMELLTVLKEKGIACAIASNKAHPAVMTLKEIYFEGYIQEASGIVDGKPAKPDTYMVDNLMKALNCKKEETLYVGDSQVDIDTAANAGLDMVAVSWGFRTEEELKKAGASIIIKHPLELLKYFS